MTELPPKGFVFWPVGNGDSTSIVVDEQAVLQVDLHHLDSANDEDDSRTPVVDRLVELLPKVDGTPYLSVFVLTHPDKDHCLGFRQLLKQVEVGELWFSPRIFWEYQKDLCDDATAFQKEAKRRVKKTIEDGSDVDSGDRVRIIGYSEVLQEEDYEGFPEDRLTVPGNAVTELDGRDHTGTFRAFIHAPFKNDAAGDRNETSIAMQVVVANGEATGKALLLGDLSYPALRRLFDVSKGNNNEACLAWDSFLAPHHCSKSAMYWKDDPEGEEKLKRDILDDIEEAAGGTGLIIASSEPIPESNEDGDNPPHAKAADRYREIAPSDFLCTQGEGSDPSPGPIVVTVTDNGPVYDNTSSSGASGKGARGESLAAAVASARGGNEPPSDRVGFGRFR